MKSGYKRKVRDDLAKRYGWQCHWCCVPLTPETATLDHIKPRCLGGNWYYKNLVLACQECNNARGPIPAKLFGRLVKIGMLA